MTHGMPHVVKLPLILWLLYVLTLTVGEAWDASGVWVLMLIQILCPIILEMSGQHTFSSMQLHIRGSGSPGSRTRGLSLPSGDLASSESWLRSGNWERDDHCPLGDCRQPPGLPSLISSAATNRVVLLSVAHLFHPPPRVAIFP